MTVSKRDKRSRIRGHRGGGYGARKKHRGKGSKGGKGMAGSGKKSGTKRVHLLKYAPGYLGAKGKGFTSMHEKKRLDVINLNEIEGKIETFKKDGIIKTTAKGMELNLEGYKVLGAGELKHKMIIKADKFSENAKQKILAQGSEIVSDKSEQ